MIYIKIKILKTEYAAQVKMLFRSKQPENHN